MDKLGVIFEFIKNNSLEGKPDNKELEYMISDRDISEIMFNGYNDIFYEKNNEIIRANNIFKDKLEYQKYIQNFLGENNIYINESRPIVDFSIGQDMRVNIIKESISKREVIMSIRKKNRMFYDKEILLKNNFYDEDVMNYLIDAVKNKKNIFISGETSTGKTTLLNMLLRSVDPTERIIIIEDTLEIVMPDIYNSVNLISRDKLYDSTKVTISDLVKTSLRLRPDRLILGEIRREEVIQYINALNTGHKGSICTGHSDSAIDMFNRLLMLLMEQNIPVISAEMQLARSMDIIVHISRKSGIRRIESLVSVNYYDNNVEFCEIVNYSEKKDKYDWNMV